MIYNIEKIAELCGVTRRTVRYYIQRGLLPAPEGKLKGAYYTEKHLEILKKIQELSKNGVPLAQMKELLNEEDVDTIMDVIRDTEYCECEIPMRPEFDEWFRVKIADGVELNFQKSVKFSTQPEKVIREIKKIINKNI